MFHKGIMLLGCSIGQRLEPMGVMRNALFQSPHAHTCGDQVGHLAVDGNAIVDGVGKGLIGFLGEVLLHRLAIEDILSEILGYFLRGSDRLHSLTVGGFLNSVEA